MTTKVSRKLIAIGGNLMMGIPREWLRSWHLSKGDSVELVMDLTNTVILIRPRIEVKKAAKK